MESEPITVTDLGLAISLVCLDYELYNVYDNTLDGGDKHYCFEGDATKESYLEIRRAYFEGTLKVNARRFYRNLMGVQSGEYFQYKARAAELPNYS